RLRYAPGTQLHRQPYQRLHAGASVRAPNVLGVIASVEQRVAPAGRVEEHARDRPGIEGAHAFARLSARLEELGRRPLAHADEDAAAGDVPVHRLMRAVEVWRYRIPPGPRLAVPPQGFPDRVRQTSVASRPHPLHVV